MHCRVPGQDHPTAGRNQTGRRPGMQPRKKGRKASTSTSTPQRTCRGGGGCGARRGGALQGHEQLHVACIEGGGEALICMEHAVRRNEGIHLHLQGFPSPCRRLCSEGRRGPSRPWLWPVSGHRKRPGPAGGRGKGVWVRHALHRELGQGVIGSDGRMRGRAQH